ncbi:hypothetical protein KZJ38_26070 [Paraburkholderia edwinii]|jgi:hypothetical protein|uniref:Uncharacterized protein n=1 Tax=Paraburkholderia edwinii TaxID=2861782 RepID=A0ABX8V0Z3_9BURK|nr:hypothetical protein [Paraburkholderia edwinii]QYD73130.1 hypothetical protein KZJ38_26070 [Paraburkholderia edwinii]
MQNHRMYGTCEICDTDDGFQMTVAIKREKDSKNTDKVSRESDNIVRIPWHENLVSKDIGRAFIGNSSVVIGSRMKDRDADPCVQKRRLRAHWEHIEGVGLRCTWIEEPEGESDATPEAKTGAGSKPDERGNSGAGTESDSNSDAE